MSDNFGSSQSRVLSVDDRSLDQVVFQDRRVPLTSEWNLINQISDFKTSEAVKVNQPSGWLRVGEIRDSGASTTTDTASEALLEASAKSGDVLTSLTYNALKIKLACRETTNVAVVNGWPLIIQKGVNSPTASDVINFLEVELLPCTGIFRYDVVFLEVWKKLIGQDDFIYPYGNVDVAPFSNNEIVWSIIGAETTKRVQIQYKIRTIQSIDPSRYPDGLGSSNIRSYIDSRYYYKSVGHKDIGLYRAGNGSLDTVDGYSYAIPMFIIYRRAQGIPYSPSTIHGSTVTRALAATGTVSDRPDGKYSDVIVADDIIDVRHQLVTSGEELEAVLRKSFRSLVVGNLKTTVGQGFTTGGQKLVCSGGSECIKIDQLNGSSSSLPSIGSGYSGSGLARRVYSKSEGNKDHNTVSVPINGSTWQEGSISISTFLPSSYGTVLSVDGFYYVRIEKNPEDPYNPEYLRFKNYFGVATGITSTTGTITIDNTSNVCGTTYVLYMEFTYSYESSNSGFFDVPKEFLEVSKHTYQPIAVRGHDIPIRYVDPTTLVTDPTLEDYVSYRGAAYGESYDFGHDLVYHTTVGIDGVTLPVISTPGRKLYNYTIHGVKEVRIKTGGAYGLPVAFSVLKATEGISYTIVLSTSVAVGSEVKVTLITGTAYNSTLSDSMKFFELNKQGRGVVDIYEMLEVLVDQDQDPDHPEINDRYTIDTINKPIIAIASYATTAAGNYVEGRPFCFDVDSGEMKRVKLISSEYVNQYLPALSSLDYTNETLIPTRVTLSLFTGPYPAQISVSVLVHSRVEASEAPYNFYYKFVPYQGLLSTDEIRGKAEKAGPAVITTLGCGKIDDYSYSDGTINVTQSSRTVVKATGSSWKYNVASGDYLVISGSTRMYRILYVGTDESGTQADTRITLADAYKEATQSGASYSIVRLDVPDSNIRNVIDRMPTYAQEDYLGRSEDLNLGNLVGKIIESSNKTTYQDVLDTTTNDFRLGESKESGSRGRNYLKLTDGDNTLIQIGNLTPYIKYGTLGSWLATQGIKKVYQAYLFNKSYKDSDSKYRDLTGRMYLMVVSSETELTSTEILLNPFSIKDSVDIFELEGRPIVKTT